MKYFPIKNISFFQIQMCLNIAEHSSFTKAAAALHVTQPTLSKRLSDLETQLGLLLFIRGKNTAVRPTPAGKILFKEWEKIVVQMELSLAKAFEAQECVSSSITVSTVPSANIQVYLEPLIDGFLTTHSDVEFRFDFLSTAHQAERLLDGSVDVAFSPLFCEGLLNNERIVKQQVLTCPWYVGMLPSNPLSKTERFAAADLRSQHFIITSPQLFPDFYSFVESICAEQGFVPNIAFSTNNHMSFIRNVRGDDEVFFVDGCSSLLDSSSFIFRELPGVESGVVMAHSTSNKQLAVLDFIQYAKSFFMDYTISGEAEPQR